MADVPKTQETDKVSPIPVHSSDDEGLSWTQKLIFLGAIVAVCALFLRSRGGSGSDRFKEKSMA